MRRAALVGLAALVLSGAAHAARSPSFVNLPSPLAPLSTAPPLGGGATSSSEGFRHRVDARTIVAVSVDPAGTPFAVHATQRLDVRVKGDYFFTIGAPLLDVEAAPGSASTPGLRSTAIIWAGFDPGRRLLVARATLVASQAAALLPLRIVSHRGQVTLVNTTGVTAGSFRADAVAAPLRTYLRLLKTQVDHGLPPSGTGAYVTGRPVAASVRVTVPLHVTGFVGRRKIDAVVGHRLVVAGGGPVHLSVVPVPPRALLAAPTTGLSGGQLLDRATQAALTLARMRQYQTFLGNPDPAGTSETSYTYRSAARPAPPAVAAAQKTERDWTTTVAALIGVLLVAAAAALIWSRS